MAVAIRRLQFHIYPLLVDSQWDSGLDLLTYSLWICLIDRGTISLAVKIIADVPQNRFLLIHIPIDSRFRKPAPSPLHNITAISPPNSPSPTSPRTNRQFASYDDASIGTAVSVSIPQSIKTPTTATLVTDLHSPRLDSRAKLDHGKSRDNSNSAGPEQSEQRKLLGYVAMSRWGFDYFVDALTAGLL